MYLDFQVPIHSQTCNVKAYIVAIQIRDLLVLLIHYCGLPPFTIVNQSDPKSRTYRKGTMKYFKVGSQRRYQLLECCGHFLL